MLRRLLLGFGATLLAAFGVLLILAAAVDSSSSTGSRLAMCLFGIGVVGASILGVAAWFPIRRAPNTFLAHDGSAVVIKLRWHLQAAGATMLSIWVILLVIGAVSSDSGGRWVLGFCALVLALPVPDLVNGLRCGAMIRIDQQQLQFRGWASDASVAWRDVDVVRFAGRGTAAPLVQISGRTGAASWSFEKRGLLFGRARTKRPDIDIPVTSLDDPFGVFLVANALASAPDRERSGLVDGIGDLLMARAAGERPEEPTSRRG
ncbi:MAG: hypothetical protein ACRDS9_08150 [Pseudonocardiaceae bacterium]